MDQALRSTEETQTLPNIMFFGDQHKVRIGDDGRVLQTVLCVGFGVGRRLATPKSTCKRNHNSQTRPPLNCPFAGIIPIG